MGYLLEKDYSNYEGEIAQCVNQLTHHQIISDPLVSFYFAMKEINEMTNLWGFV